MDNKTAEKLISILETMNRNLFVISQSQQAIAKALSHIDDTGLEVSADAYAVFEPYNGSLQVDINNSPIIQSENLPSKES